MTFRPPILNSVRLSPNAMQDVEWIAGWNQDKLILLIGVVSAGLLAVLLLLIVLRRVLRRPEPAPQLPPDERFIDLGQFDLLGPRGELPRAEVYGVPVRIALVVLAPVGRDGVAPDAGQFNDILEQLVPGFLAVTSQDKPLMKIWPGQLSAQGFTNAFFNNVPLPGDRGKGTPWCALSGRFSALGQSYLAGLVCCAAQSNGLGQYGIQHEGQWNDVLRVRREGSDVQNSKLADET
jgi:hypothetical protein